MSATPPIEFAGFAPCSVGQFLADCHTHMFITSLAFDVRPEKRTEFISAVGDILDALRSSRGCLGCRLASDWENENLFLLTAEWDSREYLDRYLTSSEFRVLEGTRILLRDGPAVSVDEVVSRRRAPRPASLRR